MKVYVTIGYADYEGNNELGKTFTDKGKVLDSLLAVVAKAWSDHTKCIKGIPKDEFIVKTKKYILNHTGTYWYFFEGCDFWKEIFTEWKFDNDFQYWFGFKETELIEG